MQFSLKGLTLNNIYMRNKLLILMAFLALASCKNGGGKAAKEELQKAKDDIVRLAETEGLTAHANSIKVRF